MLDRVLHVTNGDMAVRRLAEVVDAPILPWRDVLHDGPVPDARPAELRRVRAEFLASRGPADADRVEAEMAARDRAVQDAGHVVLWFEHDLYDQLQLLQVLALAGEREGVEAVVADRHLTSIATTDLAALPRAPVGPGVVAEAQWAWRAFTAGDPFDVAAVTPSSEVLRHVAPALHRLLEELPWTTDGLGRTERALLGALRDGPLDRHALFARSQEDEEAPFLGDVSAWALLDALGPLAARTPDGFALTALGEDVLDGRADRVAVVGIDRWLGGTRIRSPDAVWRWDPGAGVLPG